MTKIKFCGLRRTEDIIAANELRPDYIGFVFAPNSKRRITWENAARLKAALNPGILAVGVFADESITTVAQAATAGTIDIIQLHGTEDENYIAALRKMTDKKIIKAFVFFIKFFIFFIKLIIFIRKKWHNESRNHRILYQICRCETNPRPL